MSAGSLTGLVAPTGGLLGDPAVAAGPAVIGSGHPGPSSPAGAPRAPRAPRTLRPIRALRPLGVFLRGIGSGVVVALSSFALLCAASGWLYVARPLVATWPGPRLAALPLDALAQSDTVPVLLVVVSLALASVPGGLVARAVGRQGAGAAALVGVSFGVCCWLQVAASYYVVRQQSPSRVLVDAASAPLVYLAAAIAAVVAAALGREGRARSAAPAVAAAGVALAGVLDVLGALTGWRGVGAASLAPSTLGQLATPLDLPAGVILVVLARALSRRSRLGFVLAAAALGATSLVAILATPRHDPVGMVAAALLAVLVAHRSGYVARPEAGARRRAVVRGAVALAGWLLVAGGSIALHEMQADRALPAARSLGFSSWVAEAVRSLALQPPAVAVPGEASFFSWFPWVFATALAVAAAVALAPWVAPWRAELVGGVPETEEALRLVRVHGRDSLAPFALRADKSLFFASPEEPGAEQPVIAYRVVRGVALVSGAPIGPSWTRRHAIEEFRTFARRRGWLTAVLGVSAEALPAYEQLGCVGLYHGDEAFIDVASFGLEGGRMKAVRQAVRRLERHGYHAAAVYAGDVPPDLYREMRAVEASWIGDTRRKGFTMALDDLFRLGGDDALFILGFDADGRLAGFAHLVACRAGGTMSLSSMPWLRDTPNGFTSWLIVSCLEWCSANEIDTLSLNFSPLAAVLRPEATLSVLGRAERAAARRLKSALTLQLDNLQLFSRQFRPDFQPRYLVVDRLSDLPRVAVAAMAAEGYLPASERLRGWPPARPGSRRGRGFAHRPGSRAATPAQRQLAYGDAAAFGVAAAGRAEPADSDVFVATRLHR